MRHRGISYHGLCNRTYWPYFAIFVVAYIFRYTWDLIRAIEISCSKLSVHEKRHVRGVLHVQTSLFLLIKYAKAQLPHLRDAEQNNTDASKPVARHFNLPNHSQHDYLRAILTPREHRKPQKSRTKINYSTGYTLSTRN